MELRATQLSITNRSIEFNRDHFSALALLQRQLSSGLRFEKASEAPLDAARVLSLQETLQNLRSDRAQIPEVERKLNESVSTLLEVQQITTRAKQLALDASQQNNTESSKILEQELNGLIQRLELLANSKVDGHYLFSGTRIETPPLGVQTHNSLAIPTVSYNGSRENASINVSATLSIETTYAGSDIFFSRERGETLFFGNTGAKSGTGTDSGIGRSFLDVTHLETIYSGASGVQAGSRSAAEDTIVGPTGRHTLTINDTSGTGAFGTISLNGGKEIPFTSSDLDLEVIGPHGEKTFVDATNITAGFNATIDIESRATLSVDGGATSTLIDFSANQILKNSFNNQVINVDSSDINQVGRDHVEFTGSADLLTALYELKDDLQGTRKLGNTAQSESFSRRAADIDRASNQILDAVGAQSVSLQTVAALSARQSNQELELEIGITNIQGADLAKAATELKNRQTLIQANFASLSIVQNLSILNFLG